MAAARGESRDAVPPRETERSGPEEVQRLVESLTSEERMLVVLKRELYEGSWDEMITDLRARLEGRPYIFKLAHRIVDDLERIDHLRAFERRCQVDLSERITLDE